MNLGAPAGPLLTRLLTAQAVEARTVSYPQLEKAGARAARRATQIRDCLVWPVGEAAERLAAAVTLTSRGETEVGTWSTSVNGRRVLLIIVAGVSALGLEAAAAQLRRRGALEVHGCGVAIDGADQVDVLDSYTRLDIGPSTTSTLVIVGDAA